jgi:membrane dipeptidase
MTDFLDHVEYMLDLAGEDHVGIGTDINENVTVLPIPAPYELQYGPIVAGTHPGLVIPPRHTDGGPVRVKGFERLENINNVARGLVTRGHSDERVVKILGGNFMRVAREVWS